jgi:hypothetical protein
MALGILRAYNVRWLWHNFSFTVIVAHPTSIIRTQYTKCGCTEPPKDEQVMLETFRGP